MVFPIAGNLKPNFVNSDRLTTQAAKDNPPTAPSVHDFDIQPAPPPPSPAIPEAKIVKEPKREPTSIPANPEPTPIVEVETERPKSIQQQIEEAEENALYEKLLKVAANSPLPSPLTHPMYELLEELSHHSKAPSIIHSQLQTPILNEAILDPKLFKIISSPVPVTPLVYSSHVSTPHLSVNPSKLVNHTPIISQSKEEKEEDELREKLLKIVATPRNVKLPESHLGSPLLDKTETMKSPIGLPTHTPLSESMKEEEEEIAVYAAKISKRLDEAILKSPFIKSQLLSPLLRSKSISNHKSNSTSKSTTPKSISRSTTPKSSSIQVVAEEEEEEIPIPGSFVNTPKSTYLKSPLPNLPSLFDCQHSEPNEIHSKGKSQRRMSVATNHTDRSNSPLFSFERNED
ncbi:hypothetical protein DFH28DRAFT_968870 [Melampsora americana]|nr:hypothetical protein DFH28DRAFT_968870 [Melampsora americana]